MRLSSAAIEHARSQHRPGRRGRCSGAPTPPRPRRGCRRCRTEPACMRLVHPLHPIVLGEKWCPAPSPPTGTGAKLPPFPAKQTSPGQNALICSALLSPKPVPALSILEDPSPSWKTHVHPGGPIPVLPKGATRCRPIPVLPPGDRRQTVAAFLATASEGEPSATRLHAVTTTASQISSSQLEFGVKPAEKII